MSGSTMKNARNTVSAWLPTHMSSKMMNDATGMVRNRLMMGSMKSRNRRTRHATNASRKPTANDSKKPSAMRPKLAPTITEVRHDHLVGQRLSRADGPGKHQAIVDDAVE